MYALTAWSAPLDPMASKDANEACLATDYLEIARVESQIAAYLSHTSTTPSPLPNLYELIPSLLSILEQADEYPQDIFQAQACLGWIHWTLNEPGVAASRLPNDFGEVLQEIGQDFSPWLLVCLIKGCYFKCEWVILQYKQHGFSDYWVRCWVVGGGGTW